MSGRLSLPAGLLASLPASLRGSLAAILRLPAILRPSLRAGTRASRRPGLPAGLRAALLVSLAAAFFLPMMRPDVAERAVVWLELADTVASGFEDPARPEGPGGPAGAAGVAGAAGAERIGALATTRAVAPAEEVVRSTLDDALLAPDHPDLVVRATPIAPTADELAGLEALARRGPLLVALPRDAPPLRLSPPLNPRVDRVGAVTFAVRGEPGDTVPIRLLAAAGTVDSLRVTIGRGGVATSGFRVRPARPGWHRWRVATPEGGRSTGAWVRDAEPPHVLVAAGPPTWESRFVMRALEESGALVTLAQPLGRGLWVGAARLGSSAEALAEYDAVLLLRGADPDSSQLRALQRYATALGGGVLVADDGTAAAALGLAADTARPIEVDGAAIVWSLPAELTPLPEAAVLATARTWGRLDAGASGVARVGDAAGAATKAAPAGPGNPHGPQWPTDAGTGVAPRSDVLVALRPLGRGRAAALGLRETWRWRMEGGYTVEHREFWRSLVDWLAGGIRDSLVVRVPDPIGPAGVPVEVVTHALVPGTAPPRLTLTRPDGSREELPLTHPAGQPEPFRTTFVPDTAGVYTIALGEGGPRAAFKAERSPRPAADAWARLSLFAHRSGGAAVPADAVGPWLARWQAEHGADGGGSEWLNPLLFTLIAILAMTEWAVRRLRGRA